MQPTSPGDLVSQGYNAVYAAYPGSSTLRALWRQHAAGADYPDDFYHISFLTLAEMRRMLAELRLSPGDTFVDLGCGMSGPSLWIAREAQARLVGLDFSRGAVGQATKRARALALADAAAYVVGSFEAPPFAAHSFAAAVSTDALQYAPDKQRSFAEAARAVRPGGAFVFTAFEVDPSRTAGIPGGFPDPVADYRPVLERAGFAVTTYEETPGWRERLEAAYGAIVRERDRLQEEMGPIAAAALLMEVSLTLQHQPYRRRVFAVALAKG